jgi:hypothetical protein
MESAEKSDGDCPPEVSADGKDKARFRKQFKVYENFKNVYKGVRKTRATAAASHYDVTPAASHYDVAAADARSTADRFATSSNDDSSGGSDLGLVDSGCIVVAVNALNSLESSQVEAELTNFDFFRKRLPGQWPTLLISFKFLHMYYKSLYRLNTAASHSNSTLLN